MTFVIKGEKRDEEDTVSWTQTDLKLSKVFITAEVSGGKKKRFHCFFSSKPLAESKCLDLSCTFCKLPDSHLGLQTYSTLLGRLLIVQRKIDAMMYYSTNASKKSRTTYAVV